MPKNVEKMTFNYSPNFDLKKRDKSKIKYLIYHYTGMKSEKGALRRLTNINSNVSCHYFIKKNGEIIKIVPELYVAWHAGISFWKKDRSLNKKSIGIEISNPGHQNGYLNFSKTQINSVILLSKKIIKKYKISKFNILGHSDISPLRKKDPGEKFPWQYLSENNISIWHKINKKISKKTRYKKINNQIKFLKLLSKFGYIFSENELEKIKIIKSFQRRFRPELVNGIIDQECYLILKSLI
tara:strand:+ start:183 stop:902 length:720 start_codon:yes stop_codon:yes gene_type:complete